MIDIATFEFRGQCYTLLFRLLPITRISRTDANRRTNRETRNYLRGVTRHGSNNNYNNKSSRMLKIAINSLDQLLLINGVQLMRRKVSWESERDANRAIQVGEEVDIVSKMRIFIESETCANPLRIANNSYNTQFSSTISCSKR